MQRGPRPFEDFPFVCVVCCVLRAVSCYMCFDIALVLFVPGVFVCSAFSLVTCCYLLSSDSQSADKTQPKKSLKEILRDSRCNLVRLVWDCQVTCVFFSQNFTSWYDELLLQPALNPVKRTRLLPRSCGKYTRTCGSKIRVLCLVLMLFPELLIWEIHVCCHFLCTQQGCYIYQFGNTG